MNVLVIKLVSPILTQEGPKGRYNSTKSCNFYTNAFINYYSFIIYDLKKTEIKTIPENIDLITLFRSFNFNEIVFGNENVLRLVYSYFRKIKDNKSLKLLRETKHKFLDYNYSQLLGKSINNYLDEYIDLEYNSIKRLLVTGEILSKIQSNIKMYVDYDYDKSDCTGECYYYCRCNRIINLKFNKMYIQNFSDYITNWDLIDKRNHKHSRNNLIYRYIVEK